eukprot:1163419-Prymnesium_polylepis.1
MAVTSHSKASLSLTAARNAKMLAKLPRVIDVGDSPAVGVPLDSTVDLLTPEKTPSAEDYWLQMTELLAEQEPPPAQPRSGSSTQTKEKPRSASAALPPVGRVTPLSAVSPKLLHQCRSMPSDAPDPCQNEPPSASPCRDVGRRPSPSTRLPVALSRYEPRYALWRYGLVGARAPRYGVMTLIPVRCGVWMCVWGEPPSATALRVTAYRPSRPPLRTPPSLCATLSFS